MPITLSCFCAFFASSPIPNRSIRVDANFFEGGVPEMRTRKPPMPMASAFTPSTPGGRLWTGETRGREFAQLALPRYPLPPVFSDILTVTAQ